MLRNYFITAWRNLVRSRIYSIIAILGLAIGLSISILIFWGANDELSYDTIWPDAPNVYRLNAPVKIGENNFEVWAVTPFPIAALAVKSFPGIENAVHYQKAGRSMITVGNDHFVEKEPVYTDSAFFGMFYVTLLERNPETAFSLLTREFSWLVIIANVIAWPASWYAMHKWIEDFAYRTPISWGGSLQERELWRCCLPR